MNNIQKSFKTKSSLRDMAPPKMPLEQGGMVHGKGGPKDDLVGPVALSAGEYVLPADTVEIVGRENLEALRLATHDFGDEGSAPKGLRGMQAGGPVQKPLPQPRPNLPPVNMGNPLAPGKFDVTARAPTPPSLLDLGSRPASSAAPIQPRVNPTAAPSTGANPVPSPTAPPNSVATMPQRSVIPAATPAPGAPGAPGNIWDSLRPPPMPSSPLAGAGPGAPQAPTPPASPPPLGGGIPSVRGGPGAPASGEELLRAKLMQSSALRAANAQADLVAAKAAEARAEALKKSRMYTQSSAGFKDGGMIRAMADGGGKDDPMKKAVLAGAGVAGAAGLAGTGYVANEAWKIRAAERAARSAQLGSAAPGATQVPIQPVGTIDPAPRSGAATPSKLRPSGYGKPVTAAVDALSERIKAPAATPPAATPPASMASRAGSMLRGAATGAGKLAVPLTVMGSAAETYNTPTEQYAARFGVDPRAPEGVTPGTEFFRDHLLRTAGAASDLAVNVVDAVPGLWNMFAPENRQLPMLGNWVAEREAANGYVPPPPKVAAEEEWVDEPASAEEMARRQAVVDSFSESEAATPSPLRGAGYAEIGGKRYVYNPDTQGFGVTAENLPLRTRAEHAKTASEIIPARPEPTAAASGPLSPEQEANVRYDAMIRHIHGLGLRGDQYANAILNVEQQRNAALQNVAMLADRQAKAGAEYEGGLGDKFVKTIDRVAKSLAIGPEGKPDLDRQEQVRAILTNVLPPEDRDLLMRMDEPSREAALRNYLTFFEAQQIESGVDRGAQISNTLMGALPGAALLAGGIASRSPLAIKSGLATMVGGGGAMALNTPSRSNSMQHDEAATRFNPDTGREEQLPQSFSLERAMEVGPIDALTNWDNEVVSDNGRALRRLTGDAAKAKKQYDQLLNRLRGQ